MFCLWWYSLTVSEIDAYYQIIACYRFSSMESFSSVKVSTPCERLVNNIMSPTNYKYFSNVYSHFY